MNLNELRKIIADDYNDIEFLYNEKPCGISSEVFNYIPTFQMWYGNKIKEYKSVDDLILDNFFDGKSLLRIINKIKFY